MMPNTPTSYLNPNSPRLPTSPSFFPASTFESFAPSKARIRNGVRKSILIDYDTKLDDENIPSLKLLLLGSAGVGKSALLIRYSDDYFDEFDSKTTIGIDLKMKLVDVDNQLFKVVLWDTAGQERYRTITPSLYKDTQGILLVYDTNNKQTFNDLEHWLNECIDNSSRVSNIVFFIVGNKRDRPISERQVFIGDLKDFSIKMDKYYKKKGVRIAGYYEVSAKYYDDVKFLFRTFISECVRKSLTTDTTEDDLASPSKESENSISEEDEHVKSQHEEQVAEETGLSGAKGNAKGNAKGKIRLSSNGHAHQKATCKHHIQRKTSGKKGSTVSLTDKKPQSYSCC